MNKVNIIFEEDKPIFIKMNSGRLSKKGYINPKEGDKILPIIQDILFKGRYYYDDFTLKNWAIFSPGVIALDTKTNSIVYYIPENTYYIPFVSDKGQTVFKVKYPNLICIKDGANVYYYWTNDKYNDFTLHTKIYPLESPHISNGSICKGSFKEDLDYSNPKKYFIDLLTYPVSHKQEIEKLRKSEKGYKKNYNSETTMAKLLKL